MNTTLKQAGKAFNRLSAPINNRYNESMEANSGYPNLGLDYLQDRYEEELTAVAVYIAGRFGVDADQVIQAADVLCNEQHHCWFQANTKE